jgi:hypothetical protein
MTWVFRLFCCSSSQPHAARNNRSAPGVSAMQVLQAATSGAAVNGAAKSDPTESQPAKA